MALVAMTLTTAMQAQRLEPQVYSPLGRTFLPKEDSQRAIEKVDAELAKGETAEAILAAARARDQLQRFNESIPLYTRGAMLFPEDVRFLRFRGHRNISVRRFEAALVDLKQAAELAPASFDVSYHLGLAYYLRGDYNHAVREYRRCLAMASKPQPEFMRGMPKGWRSCYAMEDDTRLAISDWLYKALVRAAKKEEATALLAEIKEGMQAKENTAYLTSLLYYQGKRTEAQVMEGGGSSNAKETSGYGMAVHLMANGAKEQACEMLRTITAGENWAAFGFIAAETDLARGVCPQGKKSAGGRK